jgi:hypothetical protein
MQYQLEIFLTKFNDQQITYKQVILDITGKTENPDDLVLLSIQKFNSEIIQKNRLISHSTSWRYDKGSESVIITYIVYSDDFDFTDSKSLNITDINIVNIVSSDNLSKPAPENITPENVVSHGIRHLSYLVANRQYVYEPPTTLRSGFLV